ncbi:MAG TPA: tetratricopeptide repeat protein [Verrucomicrobiae bacterium]|nr:tetratricopeptide repeat protein [Verrucomicrobiae bacterium]
MDYDDPHYVTQNFHVQRGLSWANLRWAFSDTRQAGFWHPLTWLSHMADCQWFGLNPRGHHFTSILIHALNAVLVFLVFKRMTGTLRRSFFLAGIFALHPLRVESVAWVAERKDVLSALFWLLTMWAYLRFVEEFKIHNSKSKMFYALALLLFALALMSKPMAVTLPFVLLLLDYWPLQRFNVQGSEFRIGNAVLEKIPFFIFAIAASLVTFLAQSASNATSIGLPFAARAENALVSYCRYLGKVFCPVDLAFFYPHPGFWPVGVVVASAILLLGISIFVLAFGREHPYLPVGWFWFLGTLVPVVGLVQAGAQAIADRFTYIPSIGVLVILIWGVIELAQRWRFQLFPLAFAAAAAMVVCIFLTRQQIGYWKNSETLCEHALAVTKNNYVAHFCLGVAFEEQNRTADAIAEYRAAIAIQPDYAPAHNDLGAALGGIGRLDEALDEFAKALKCESDTAQTHFGMGVVFGREGQMQNAISEFQMATKLEPDWPEAHYNLGIALEADGQAEQAVGELQTAVRLEPDSAKFRFNLGNALAQLNRQPEAIEQFQKSLALDPSSVECRVNLATALARSGRLDEAIAQFREALKLKPDAAEIHNNLGLALAMYGQTANAVAEFQQALKLKPDFAAAQKNLADWRNRTNIFRQPQ